ncbi:hypothetical protein DFJ74DRAFT_738348 [Hyaloraphidium curvatum]|nr:hypothetical protein DFJ74DRAFT_738348 [Hyaloraphidium curvatum]
MAAKLDWFGCSTYRLTLPAAGRAKPLVIFLDAYLDRVDNADKPDPLILPEHIDEADFIVVGHSHFDHLWGAERIALRTGATIIGSYESCRIMRTCGVPDKQLIHVAGGERIQLYGDVFVNVLPSLHSCVWVKGGGMGGPADEVCIGELGIPWHERQRMLGEMFKNMLTIGEEAREHLRVSDQKAKGDGGAFLYHFETPLGTLLYQDTSGHWTGILERHAPPTDVAIFALAGRPNKNGEPLQGSLAGFGADQAELLLPRLKRVIVGHHDNWLPGFSGKKLDLSIVGKEVSKRTKGKVEVVDLDYVSGYELFQGIKGAEATL